MTQKQNIYFDQLYDSIFNKATKNSKASLSGFKIFDIREMLPIVLADMLYDCVLSEDSEGNTYLTIDQMKEINSRIAKITKVNIEFYE